MPQINGGTVAFVRRLNMGNFNHQEASATIQWSTAEGEDPNLALRFFHLAGQLAQTKVEELLTGAKSATIEFPASEAPPEPVVVQPEAAVVQPVRRGPGRPPKPPVQQVVLTEEDKAIVAAAAVKDVAPEPERPQPAISTGEARVDEWEAAEDLTTAPPADITDRDILVAITDKNKTLNNAPAIRELIGKFSGPAPHGAREIPQGARQKFLEELDALGK